MYEVVQNLHQARNNVIEHELMLFGTALLICTLILARPYLPSHQLPGQTTPEPCASPGSVKLAS
jgi:hypothetical protein